MATEGTKQKLAAIISADVKDYSRLLSQDRVSTIKTLNDHREMFNTFVQQYGGRVVDTPGDNILVVIESVSDAVNCAVEIQRELSERNAEVPSARMMQWRIGVNLGDVVEEEGKVYGDGINIAARVEKLAEPGGICVSGRVYDQVHGKLGLEYESLGEQTVKNIANPIRVYRVLSYPGAAAHRVVKAKGDVTRKWRNVAWVTIAVVILFVGAIMVWNYAGQVQVPSPGVAKPETPTTPAEKPSIAVLPFDNMSGDPEQEYFSDGISEDILNGLAKSPGLDVIARTSSFRFKGQNQDIRSIGRQLNATHVLEGSVRKSNSRIRITAQLINTDRGTHLWSEQYDRELTDVFEVQDDISGKILNALKIHLLSNEKDIPTKVPEAYDAYLMGRNYYNLERWPEAEESLKRTIQIDPEYADAYGMLSLVNTWYIWYGYSSAIELAPVIRDYADAALLLDPAQPEALIAWSYISFYFDREYQTAIDRLSSLLSKYPNSYYVFDAYRNVLISIGEFNQASRIHDHWVSIDPLNPLAHSQQGTFLLIYGNMAESLQSYDRMKNLGTIQPTLIAWAAFLYDDMETLRSQVDLGEANWGSGNNWHPIFRAAVYYLEGNQKKVAEVLTELKQSTGYISYFMRTWIASLEDDLDLALEYYAKALSEFEFGAYNQIQSPTALRKLHPDYRSHPKYQKMLRDVGLDAESVAKLRIPPLPF